MPKARRPPIPATPSPATITSSTMAERAEPVTTSRTTQHAAMPPAIAQRLRLRRCSGTRARRRAASLPSVIEHRPLTCLESSVARPMADPSVPITESAGPRHRGCEPAHPPVNESPASSRHLEVVDLNDGLLGFLLAHVDDARRGVRSEAALTGSVN